MLGIMTAIPIHAAKLVVRPVAEFPGYAASIDGRVFSLPRTVPNGRGHRRVPPRELPRRRHGTRAVVSVGRGMNVGAAVLRAFVGPPPLGHVCCHNNGDADDNRLSNVRWDTVHENAADLDRHGVRPRGDRHWSRLHPERVVRGDRHWSRLHPERRAVGKRNGAHTHPERRPRGERSGAHTRPERRPRGERNGSAKLTAEIVVEARRRNESGETAAALAREFGVSPAGMSFALTRRTWKHLP